MAVTLPYPTLSASVLASELEANFSALEAGMTNITAADFAGGGAAINPETHLTAYYEYININATLDLTTASTIAGPPVNNVFVPFYNDGKGDWTVVAGQWATVDTGDPSAVIKVDWGKFNGAAAPGAMVSLAGGAVVNIATYTMVGANIASQGTATVNTSTIAFTGGQNGMLRFYVSTNDADASTVCSVSLLLKRAIKS